MRTTRHWIIAHASTDDPAWQAELPGLALPGLQRWLAAARVTLEGQTEPDALSTPHEQALARALGWPLHPDGAYPWAGWHAGRRDVACAWLLPCHWQISLDHIVLLPPQTLQLSPPHAAALRTTWAALAEAEGLTLTDGGAPWRWLASGALLEGWRSASLHRVAHRRLDPAWQPGAPHPEARRLRRLLEEAAMLWHTHPVNEERTAGGLPAINGLWVEGAGRWTGDGPAADAAAVMPVDALSEAVLRGDLAAWRATWQRLDAEVLTPALQAAQADQQPRWLTLCGERGWRTWCLDPATAAPPPRRWWPWRRTPAPTPTVWWLGL